MPLYDTLGASAVQYIIQHASVSVILVAGDKFKHLLPVLPTLKQQIGLVIYWGTVDSVMLLDAEKTGVPVQAFEAFLARGAAVEAVDPMPPSPKDPACIMYTRCVGVERQAYGGALHNTQPSVLSQWYNWQPQGRNHHPRQPRGNGGRHPGVFAIHQGASQGH